MQSNSHPQDKKSRVIRTFVYAQVAVQVGIALTPFWANTVSAAITPPPDNAALNTTAGTLNSFGQAAQSGSLNGLASQQATGMATQQLQQWLSGYGTARVELGTDSHFKPRTGAVDLLLPLYKSEDRLLFTQNGMRNTDGQFTGNFGIGQRHFLNSWMLGYNAFYDQNFSRGHKRVGMGAEAWRDYLKLSGNGYFRVSGWRNSGDVEDYDARPANGFDLRAESWLPAYPSIGGRLMYEQYYGDEVALFGKDKRQRNPNAVTAGLSWTPVPIVSLTADHKKGASQSESILGLQFSWQLGQSLSSQLDPANVGAKRLLAGSAMDLVERNNNIVLEYRKQQVIELSLPKEIKGESGSTQPISYKLNSKYGLDKIVWNDAAITAAGGKVEDLGAGRYQLVLPKYVAGNAGANTHVLTGVAYDVRGNASKTSSMLITVTRPAISAKNSTTVSDQDTILADGKATSLITITLMDDQNQPVTGLAADLNATVKEQAEIAITTQRTKAKAAQLPAQAATLSNIVEKSNGVYTLTLTSATRPATATVTPVLDTLQLNSVNIKQISDAASATVKEGDLKLIADNIVANGNVQSRVQARVTDATGNPVAGVTVTFTLSGSAQVAAGSNLTGVSDNNGYVTLSFTDIRAEIVTVTASTTNGGNAQVNATFIADSSTAQLIDGSMNADRTSAVANGTDKITYSIKVQDANGNLVSGVAINWNTDIGNLSAASSMTNAEGIAQIALTSTTAAQATVSATLNGTSMSAQPVNFTADAGNLDPAGSSLQASVPSIVANGTAVSEITLTLKDRNGNLVSGQPVTFASSLTGSQLSNVTDKGDGTYTATLSGTKSGSASITALINGSAFGVAAVTVTLTADSSNLDATKSSLNAVPATIVANNTAASQITFTLKDINDNPVSGQTVALTSSLADSAFSSVTDNGDGTYSASLTGTKAGVANITTTVNGISFAVAAATVTLTADSSNLDAAQSSFSATPTTIVADGTTSSALTLTLKDKNGNLVSDQSVTFSSSLTGTRIGTVVDHKDGTYTASLTGTQAGTENVTVSVNSTTFGVSPATVTLIGDASNLDATKSSLTATPATIVANNSDASTITLLLKDVNDNTVNGLQVDFVKSLTGSNIGAVSNSGDGIYTATLKGTQAGSESITVTVAGNAFAVTAASVTLTPDSSTAHIAAGNLKVSKTSILANNTDKSVVTAKVTDANGNALPGITVTWTTNKGALSATSSVTDANGNATVDLTGSLSGDTTADEIATVSATPGSGTAVNAPQVTLMVPPVSYTGPQFTFTGNDGAKTNSIAITGRTGTVKDTVTLTVTTTKPDKRYITYTLIAPDNTAIEVKGNGDPFESVVKVNFAGKNKAGTWKLKMDDLQTGNTTYTMDWSLTL